MVSIESPWQTMVAAALLGTARQPFQPAIAPGKLGQMLNHLQSKPSETALLLTAATLSLHQRVGWQPETRPIVANACSRDDLPRCSPRASRCLQHILAGQSAPLLMEWLHLAAIAQQRVPEMHLPALLDKGRQQRELRSVILPVLGQRGRWLAAQHPDWNYAVAPTTEADWDTGTTAARLLTLQALRQQAPDRARALLAATWSQETASDRARFLETLQTGLSEADMPFLEQALGDRSKEVRRVAIELLASLPQSRLCQVMTPYTCRYLSVSLSPDPVLQVQVPDQFDDAWMPLGIEQKPSAAVNAKLGEKAWWLLQMMGATPLNTWTDRWQLSPQEIVNLTHSHEWQMAVLDGFALAAQRQRNHEWLEAIFKLYLTGQVSIQDAALIEISIEDLFKALSRDRQNAMLIDLLNRSPQKINDSLTIWLLRYNSPAWNLELAQLVLNQLEYYLTENRTFSNFDWELRTALKEFAQLIPVELTREVIDLRSKLNSEDHWLRSIDDLLEILQFRQEMTQAFGS